MIWAALTLGLLGSFHCAGMCGPLVLAVRSAGMQRKIGALLYHAGRGLMYMTLGLAAGLLGRSIVQAGIGQWISIIAGVIILVGIFFSRIPSFSSSNGLKFFQILFRKMVSLRSPAGVFGLGILNGILPCGLVVAALGTAVAGENLLQSMVIMGVFAAGTWPMMLTIHMANVPIPLKMRQTIVKLFPAVMLVTAILLILRGMNLGIPYISPSFTDNISCH